MKVLHVSTYDANGGAGRAAHALHAAMREQGISSSMLVAHKSTDDRYVHAIEGRRAQQWRLSQFMDRRLWDLQKSANASWRSPAVFGAISAEVINSSGADIVNLHWVTNGFLSIKEISRITKPTVWSLYDMWVVGGAEHYGLDDGSRLREGYSKGNRPTADKGLDIDHMTWNRKQKYWQQPRFLVPASNWLAKAAKASALTSNWPSRTIAHVVDTASFTPTSQAAARASMGLPADVPIVLFLSSAGITDHRKGWDLLEQAMPAVLAQHPNAAVAVAGPRPSAAAMPAHLPIHWLGEVRGNQALRDLYASADVVAVPSREDNMPLTAMEAHSVGVPVAAFAIGGLPDIVVDGQTGILAPPFDVAALSEGISRLLSDGQGFGARARAHAIATWSPEVVVAQYQEVYEGLLS